MQTLLPVVLITLPLASFWIRLTLRAVGMNLVTSPITFLICGLASMVAPPFFSLAPPAFCGGFMILGGALSTLGFDGGPPIGGGTPGGGIPGGAPGGRISLGGGMPVKQRHVLMSYLWLSFKTTFKPDKKKSSSVLS